MKAWIRLIVFAMALSLSVLCFIQAQWGFNNRPYQEMVVAVYPAETPFITVDTVNKMLIQKIKSSSATLKDGIALIEVEAELCAHNMVADAQVFTTISGKLFAEVYQREPVAKVVSKEVYYIDLNAEKMPLSPSYTATVPVVSGAISTAQYAAIRDAVQLIKRHPLYGETFLGLDEVRDAWFELRLSDQPATIELGELKALERKLNNYSAFMVKATKDKLLDRYEKISLAFEGQVVGTKK